MRTLGAGHRESASFFMEQIQIKEIVDFDVKIVEAINHLLNQLVSKPMAFTDSALKQILSSDASQLFLIYVADQIAGMLTLGHYVSPTGVKYWVEDVVVDHSFRGRALGRRLIDFAIDYVKKQGEGTLMLTSRPSRVAANHLYQSAGFQSKQTNVYIMEFKDEASVSQHEE